MTSIRQGRSTAETDGLQPAVRGRVIDRARVVPVELRPEFSRDHELHWRIVNVGTGSVGVWTLVPCW